MQRTKEIFIQEKYLDFSQKEKDILLDLELSSRQKINKSNSKGKSKSISINTNKIIKILFNIKLWKIQIQISKIK